MVDGRALARPVGAQEAERLARRHREADAADRLDVAEALLKALDDDASLLTRHDGRV
jgi:hypothetical protein